MKESCVQDFTQKNNLFDIVKSLKFKNTQSPLLICVFYVIQWYNIPLVGAQTSISVSGAFNQWEQRSHNHILRQKELSKTE